LNTGFDVNLPWQSFVSSNIYYGSGFTNGSPNDQYPNAYLPGHTEIDLALGKQIGEYYSVSVNALNITNRHVLIDNSLTFGGFHYNNPREVYVELRYRFHY
jgi:outer membrane receptor protein involved in Fe transport